MRPFTFFFLLVVLASNTACATCYGVRVKASSPHTVGLVYFGDDKLEIGENGEAPPTRVCARLPETITFAYSTEGARSDIQVPIYKLPPVVVRQRMPKKFMSNPARLLYLELDENRQPLVLFNMKLSDTTTKLIPHDETEIEKQQRLKDESLYLAIKNQNVNAVKTALAKGASVIQPWISTSTFHEDRSDIWSIYNLAMETENPEIISEVLDYKAPFREKESWTALYHNYQEKALNLKFEHYNSRPRYVSNRIAEILLSHGANPNYGVKIYFNWIAHPELEKRADMPRGARYKDAPIDRLIYTAVNERNVELVKILLENGAETNFRLPASRRPPEWWDEGELFLDWVNRTASDEIKSLIVK